MAEKLATTPSIAWKSFEDKMNNYSTIAIFRFLQSRSAAFLSDDYYQSDKDWMDLNSKIEVTIGPYEVISCPA